MATVNFTVTELYGKVRWNLPFIGAAFQKASPIPQTTRPVLEQNIGKPTWGELELGGINFVIPPTFTLRQSLNKKETPLAGIDGSVKEVMGWQDWKVNLKCFLTNNAVKEVSSGAYTMSILSDEVPDDRVREIINLKDMKRSQKVVSPFLNMVGIQYLLIEDIYFPELDDYSSVIPVELACVSDRVLEIRLNQNS